METLVSYVKAKFQVYLRAYEIKPVLTSFFGVVGALILIVLIAWAYLIFTELLGASALVVRIIIAPLLIAVFLFAFAAVLLANESLWRAVGLYRLLGVSGHPIKDSIERISEE